MSGFDHLREADILIPKPPNIPADGTVFNVPEKYLQDDSSESFKSDISTRYKLVTMSREVEPYEKSFAVLKGNTFGILESDGTDEEKIGRLLALIPMYMEIEYEARATISRLRDENERLKSASIEDL